MENRHLRRVSKDDNGAEEESGKKGRQRKKAVIQVKEEWNGVTFGKEVMVGRRNKWRQSEGQAKGQNGVFRETMENRDYLGEQMKSGAGTSIYQRNTQ